MKTIKVTSTPTINEVVQTISNNSKRRKRVYSVEAVQDWYMGVISDLEKNNYELQLSNAQSHFSFSGFFAFWGTTKVGYTYTLAVSKTGRVYLTTQQTVGRKAYSGYVRPSC
jgi:hypothetical protein